MKKIAGKKLLGILLALVLVIGLVPCVGMTAKAEPLDDKLAVEQLLHEGHRRTPFPAPVG